MKIFDLTHVIESEMPVFPGTEPPDIIVSCTMEEHGFIERKISMYSHTGTHIDAPAHLITGGYTLDEFPVDKFSGRACIYRHQGAEKEISISCLTQLAKQLQASDFLLIATGWDQYWGKPEYFGDFPVLAEDAARWLVQFNLKGIGLDVISADTVASTAFSVHKTILGSNMVIVENLRKVKEIPGNSCYFYCFPLKIQNADGSPVRAVAVIDQILA